MTDNQPTIRDPVVDGRSYKYEVGDRSVYVTVNLDDGGSPIEVFVKIGKPTDDERVAADIIGRLISVSLTFGAPVDEIVQHLASHTDGTGAFAKGMGYFGTVWEAVARALEDDAGPLTVLSPANSPVVQCPQCLVGHLVKEETFSACKSCGWSRLERKPAA